eukprot:5852440-Prymnesium_polylepis.1
MAGISSVTNSPVAAAPTLVRAAVRAHALSIITRLTAGLLLADRRQLLQGCRHLEVWESHTRDVSTAFAPDENITRRTYAMYRLSRSTAGTGRKIPS